MSLKPFTYPFPETRFLHSGTSVYKFKIRYGDSIRGEEVENKEVIIQELEDSIRVVLGNLDSLQPFATEHFVVFPYKSKWERVSHLKFKNGDIVLIPYPFVLTLYVELKWFNENLSSGRPVDDGSLGLVLAERKAARAMKKKRKRMELSISPSRPGPDSGWTEAAVANQWSVRSERLAPAGQERKAKMRTSSQGPSRKKLLLDTSRNMERNTQQGCQETPAFDGADGQAQGSRWEESPPGETSPPLQQSNAPPPAGPTGPGTGGFFGFLSSFFPFRYFFGKSSQ